MGKVKQLMSSDHPRKRRPALTPEGRENQLVSLAIDLVEQQLIDGTASSQVITHYLKLGSQRDRIERELLEKQKGLIDAKVQALLAAKLGEQLFEKAIAAFRTYNGQDDEDES